ncbi:NAD(P)/FAD-dependent oxidoreductase [Microbacterium hominis]|uniref:phytoene desaturase family protein n=1 Tax=Microbacterium TaxID=33882 RepID=UPI00168BF5F4|nr:MULTISPECIES: NAD(P)/FAD-dependent oxidoreductase [Microbacterium]QOC26722.1 NAD(P)/FAD-dependent oxidoreductase [Microbacterium hominis]QOC27899.1 NAD(P)/FAD-dependent oxidoreductase [Microbacterium hominis]QYF96950.1 NAD(P)/FAD-dependent oxidoreductase [Microbacterium sp. PAMC21962]
MTDVEVVGSGPNGLAAAVTLARAGLSVRVFERMPRWGGGARTAETVAPGFRHDTCSAVHPLAVASPFFRAFGLARRIPFVTPEISFAHPLGAADGGSGIAYRDLDRTVAELGRDGAAYRRLLGPLAARAREVARFTGSPLLRVPPHPVVAARFGMRALQQGSPLWNAGFAERVAPAMMTGVAAHAIAPQPSPVAAAAGLALQAHAHAAGWPLPVGGSQAISDALADDLRAHGGEIVTDHEVTSLDELTAAAIVLDVTPRALIRLAGHRMPAGYRSRLERFRYGSGSAKVQFALSGPVPWADERIARAGTVHIGGTRERIAAGEREVLAGRHAASPYVLVAQPSVFDSTRAPAGQHALWAYTHVPTGSTVDQTEAVTRAIEEVAPGFRDVILATRGTTAAELALDNPNYVGGDIAAGVATLPQLLARPVLSVDPWRTPLPGVYLCGASTVPGPGVHGQSGWFAARSVLRHEFGIARTPSLAP